MKEFTAVTRYVCKHCREDFEYTAPDLARKNYKLNCPEWEQKEEE